MLYDILAALWEEPAPADHLRQAVTFRTGMPASAQTLERYLRLLAECGYLNTLDRGAAPVYALAERGSRLLADCAQAYEPAPSPQYSEA
jgi:hypothetical protein